MQNNEEHYKALLAGLAAAATYLFGAWDALLLALLVFVLFDYATGVAAAWQRGEISSKRGLKGITKKVGIFIVVAVANITDGLIADGAIAGVLSSVLGVTIEGPVLRTATCWLYIVNEVFSVFENLKEMGVPIPEYIANAFARGDMDADGH